MTIQHASGWQYTHLQQHRQLNEAIAKACANLVSRRTGLISNLPSARFGTEDFALWQTQAVPGDMARLTYHAGRDILWGAGYGLTRQEATIAAIGETVERYSASLVDPQDIVWATYQAVSHLAIPPTKFVQSSPQEQQQFSNLAVFDPARPIGWTRGTRLADGQSVLVPANLVYLGYKSAPHERFSPGISTGLAAGPNWEWAVLKGILECVERDAFTISYLNRLPVPEIDLSTVNSARIQDLLSRIPPWEKVEIRAWRITLDIGIPVVLAVARSRGREQKPAIACGASAHVDPEAALFKAILESVQTRAWLAEFLRLPPYRTRRLASDFNDVTTRHDHIALGAQPDYVPHLDWLLSPREKIPFTAVGSKNGKDELNQATHALEQAGLETIVCDLTTPDVAQTGFRVCRVLVTGAQHLTFGPIRLLGNPRLYTVPYRTGFTATPTHEATLNPIPHPFP